MWRPEGWCKYWGREKDVVSRRNGVFLSKYDDAAVLSVIGRAKEGKAYEAGADAMLEALRKMGNEPRELLGLTELFQNHKVVFIPDEE